MMGMIARGFTLALAGVAATASLIVPENDVPSWASDSTMQLSLSSNKGSILPVDYNIVPLTQNLGLNGSEVVRGAIKLEGIMFKATQETYTMTEVSNLIAYLSCDASTDANAASPDDMLLRLMDAEPKAIVLYSTVGNWCMLTTSEVPYATLFTMADAGDAGQADDFLKNTNELGVIQVTITGNTSDTRDPSDGNTGHSAVAMTVLYTITGLITFLFLAIIGTGAVRAHRHPERYGPRASYGGRPPQSRARGLARAVLETLPIVKFGNPDPPKQDPNYELEAGSIQQLDGTVEPGAQTAPPGRPSADANEETTQSRDLAAARVAAPAPAAPGVVGNSPRPADEHLGCTICTEDFNMGEDVRVLPCDHKFHPNCIDPWLVNVSGTCPLCRLDLRPRREDGSLDDESSDENSLAPPLGSDGQDSDSGSQRRRASRLLDFGRLRHASAEERILALRQYRTEQRARDHPRDDDDTETASASDRDTGRRRGKLSDRLRDKFRVRTRPQGADDPNTRGGDNA